MSMRIFKLVNCTLAIRLSTIFFIFLSFSFIIVCCGVCKEKTRKFHWALWPFQIKFDSTPQSIFIFIYNACKSFLFSDFMLFFIIFTIFHSYFAVFVFTHTEMYIFHPIPFIRIVATNLIPFNFSHCHWVFHFPVFVSILQHTKSTFMFIWLLPFSFHLLFSLHICDAMKFKMYLSHWWWKKTFSILKFNAFFSNFVRFGFNMVLVKYFVVYFFFIDKFSVYTYIICICSDSLFVVSFLNRFKDSCV